MNRTSNPFGLPYGEFVRMYWQMYEDATPASLARPARPTARAL